MSSTPVVQATYAKTGVSRFDGHPFIEAQPALEQSKSDYLTLVAHYPPEPTRATRQASEVVRFMELSNLGDLVTPFPEFEKAGLALATMIRESYVSRNPLTSIDRQRRHALATGGTDGVPFPRDWKSSASGHTIMSISGMGKTTFTRAFMLKYPQVIQHTSYEGQDLKCFQVVYVFLRIPHDATLRSLCLQFFEEIDSLLGTAYLRQATAIRNIAPMVTLMRRVADAVSLGMLIVDEVQNLRNAIGNHAEQVLNMFSEIVERHGISLLTLATPALQPVIEMSVRNGRKLTSAGETIFKPMALNDFQFESFCETYWQYTYTKNKGELNDKVRRAWFQACGGNTAFAALSFMLAQRNEIGSGEVVTEDSFLRIAETEMAFLQPAVRALISGDPGKMAAFDDLIFSPRYKAMRAMLGLSEENAVNTQDTSEFDDIVMSEKGTKPKSKSRKRKTSVPDSAMPFLPQENPLAR